MLEPTHDNARCNRDAALCAFLTRKVEFDSMLARLQSLSAEHFDITPDEVHWGHVGTLTHYADGLKRIINAAFREGEHKE
jgi:hypothetical protein